MAIATLDIAAPGEPASCDTAKSSVSHHLIRNAERDYGKILTNEPSSECALQGMKEVVTAWCAWGKTLKEHLATVEAVKAYTTALEDQPMSAGADKCALEGLGGVSSSVAATGCSNHPKGTECNVTLINVYGVNGRNGFNGRNGLNGRNGTNGTNGSNGRNGENGLNGHNGKNSENGKNGGKVENAYLCAAEACP